MNDYIHYTRKSSLRVISQCYYLVISESLLHSIYNSFTAHLLFYITSVISKWWRVTQKRRREVDTIRKSRFFEAIDNKPFDTTIKNICWQKNILYQTDKFWLRLWKLLNDSFSAACHQDKFRHLKFWKLNNELLNYLRFVEKSMRT